MSNRTPRHKGKVAKNNTVKVSNRQKMSNDNPSENEIIESQLLKKQIENSALKKILNSIVKDLEK